MKSFYRKSPTFLSLAAGVVLLTGCVPEDQNGITAKAREAARHSPFAIFEALQRGDQDLALALLADGVKQHERDREGHTALMAAARARCPRVAWQLLPQRVGATLPQDKKGHTALVHAARAGEVWLVGELLQRGASPNHDLPGGGTLVAECLSAGRLASARLLLAHGARLESRDHTGSPLMEIAIRKGQAWLVSDLISRGWHYRPSAATREQPLAHLAASSGQSSLIDLLAEQGIDLQALNPQGENAVHAAIALDNSPAIQALAAHGVSLDQADRDGFRPLHRAVQRRAPASLRTLLALGANPRLTDLEHHQALDHALAQRDFAFASLLLRYGAPLSPHHLFQALSDGDRELFDFLLAHGADPEARPPLALDSPLTLALWKKDRWAVRRLLQAGAHPNLPGRNGQTPFHHAVALLDHSLISLMLRRGADPNRPFAHPPSREFQDQVTSPNIARSTLRHTRRVTPLTIVVDSGDLELARLLLSYGADATLFTRGGRYHYWYPISWAARRGDVPMMQLLLGREPSQVTRWAKVDLSQQRTWVYEGEEEIYSTSVSTGKTGFATRTGTFVITNRYPNWNSTIYESSMPYFQRFSCSDFGFHEGSVPGYPASHGCIRVPKGNVLQLWKLLRLGDKVVIQP
ncbi:ankyrin repeat domain-containing protein [Roseibacillus ishigakijimensis]|uniref:Ankyrin repeat domain-containing protein n=1 Tax=Roseibacillus ishigakijimensis TaxID=454146 RepID=A0A934VK13_9BACT|nr:ankyrin repeat domain-containing protein [Roseibacillus ishigakijimensis]MBK1833179.1 ankyrin repeat domain-containing protein [Roseibacillus ishigakijimensis]